jgi:hypothetical protein
MCVVICKRMRNYNKKQGKSKPFYTTLCYTSFQIIINNERVRVDFFFHIKLFIHILSYDKINQMTHRVKIFFFCYATDTP